MKNVHSISFRITINMLIIAAMVIAAVLTPYFYNNRVSSALHNESQNQDLYHELLHMHIAIQNAGIAIRDNVLNMNLNVIGGVGKQQANQIMIESMKGKYFKEAAKAISSANKAYLHAESLSQFSTPQVQQQIKQLGKSWKTLQAVDEKVVHNLKNLMFAKANGIFVSEAYVQTDKLNKIVNQISQLTLKQVVIRKNIVLSDLTLSRIISMIFLIIALGIGLLLTGSIVINLRKRLNLTIRAITDIAEGEGDLTRRMPTNHRDELDFIADGFNKFAAKIQTLIEQVVQSTSALISAAHEFSESSQKTLDLVNKLKEETNQITSSTENLSSASQHVAEKSDTTLNAANETESTSQEGQKVVGQTITTIRSLASEVENAASVIQGLEKESKQIGNIIEVINGISEQTNLLALNASIEAARAGEHGRGFAVVADEVRSLAMKTQESTEEIKSMIERIQAGTQKAVIAMSHGRNSAQSGVDQAEAANVSLQSITTAVTNIKSLNQEIAVLANDQSTTAENLKHNIINIQHNTDETAEGANMIAKATEQLTQLANDLDSIAKQFKI